MKRKDILPTVLEGVAIASTNAAELIDQNNSVKIFKLDDWNGGADDFAIPLRWGKMRKIAENARIPKMATIVYAGKEGAWSEPPVTIPEENTVKIHTESAFHKLDYVFKFDNIKSGTLKSSMSKGRPCIEFETEQDIAITVDFRQERNTKGVERYFFRGFNWFNSENSEMFLYYGDSFFDTPATKYNPQLMTLSLNLELAACIENDDVTRRSESIQRLLRNMGCREVYINDVYTSSPTIKSTDIAVGFRTCNGCNLIFLVLSGAHYSVEFAANLMIGREGDHTGFALSAEAGLDALRTAIQRFKITGKTKILIAGYSRTAAGSNLLSKYISDSIANGTVQTDIGDIELTQDDVYGICLETPLCGYYDESEGRPSPDDPRYANIWYTTNPDDPVTYIPTAKYGFVRYGNRVILNADHDTSLNRAMLANISAYVGKNAVKFYDMSKFRGVGGFTTMEEINTGFVQKFFDALGSREFYYDCVEEDIVYAAYVGRCKPRVFLDIIKESGGIVNIIMDLHNYHDDHEGFVNAFRPKVEVCTQKYGYGEYTDNIVNAAFQINSLIDRYCNGNVVSFVRDHYIRPMIRNTSRVRKAHYPAITLSYLMIQDENYTVPFTESIEEPDEEDQTDS